MMGLEPGHITSPEIGLTRNEALKACGNGVVPQQAKLALQYLLQGIPLPGDDGVKRSNLPTPAASDPYTENLKSSQTKEGSMHSITLPRAIKRLETE
jgi:hypothetical protein